MKSVLVFIQDQHELKILSYIHLVLNKLDLDSVDVVTRYKSKEVRDLIEIELNVRKYVELTGLSINRLGVFKYRLSQLCFFLQNKRYNSCKQKIYEFLGYSKKEIILNNVSYFSNVMVKILMFAATIINCKYSSFRKDKNTKKQGYDYIVFIRSDSLENSSIAKKFSSEKTKIITIIRNVDTPLLKGPYVVNSDYTFCMHNFEYEILKQIGAQYTGKLAFIQDKNILKLKRQLKNKKIVLICLTAEWFLENQEKMIESLIAYIPNTVDIYLKLHSSSGFGYFKFEDRYSNVFVYKSNPRDKSYESQTIESIERFNNLMAITDVLITYGSTIVLEASEYDIESYYIRVDQDVLYLREHLSWICDNFVKGFLVTSYDKNKNEYEIIKSDLEFF